MADDSGLAEGDVTRHRNERISASQKPLTKLGATFAWKLIYTLDFTLFPENFLILGSWVRFPPGSIKSET